MMGLITGFLEAGGAPEQGIAREVAQETGLSVSAPWLVGAHDCQRISQMLITHHAVPHGQVRLSPERVDQRLLRPESQAGFSGSALGLLRAGSIQPGIPPADRGGPSA